MVKNMGKPVKRKWVYIISVLIILYILASLSVFLINGGSISQDKIAVIKIYGPISLDSSSPSLLPSKGVKSQTIIDDIKKIKKDKAIKGLIVEINSPGGTTVASEEIATAINRRIEHHALL